MTTDPGPSLRDAGPDDADALTTLLLRSRTQAMPWLVSPHDEASTRWWVKHVLVADQHVRVAHDDDRLLGFAAVDGDWLTQLYVDPDHQRRGVGRALLDDATRRHNEGLRLRVFTRNTGARRFYEAAGFVLVATAAARTTRSENPTAPTPGQSCRPRQGDAAVTTRRPPCRRSCGPSAATPPLPRGRPTRERHPDRSKTSAR